MASISSSMRRRWVWVFLCKKPSNCLSHNRRRGFRMKTRRHFLFFCPGKILASRLWHSRRRNFGMKRGKRLRFQGPDKILSTHLFRIRSRGLRTMTRKLPLLHTRDKKPSNCLSYRFRYLDPVPETGRFPSRRTTAPAIGIR